MKLQNRTTKHHSQVKFHWMYRKTSNRSPRLLLEQMTYM